MAKCKNPSGNVRRVQGTRQEKNKEEDVSVKCFVVMTGFAVVTATEGEPRTAATAADAFKASRKLWRSSRNQTRTNAVPMM